MSAIVALLTSVFGPSSGTVEAGKQPSGMAINRAGTLALVANRADDSVSMLSIEGKSVKLVGTVSVANPSTTPGTQAAPPATPSAVPAQKSCVAGKCRCLEP